MKKSASFFMIILLTLTLVPSVFAAHSKKVAFKLSVVMPEHVGGVADTTNHRNTRIIRAPQDQIIVEQTTRNDQKIILKTAVVK